MGFSSVFYVDIVCDGCINDDLIPPFAKSFRKGDLVVYEMGHRDFYLENWKIPGKWDYTEEHLNSSFEREGYETLKFQQNIEVGDLGGEKLGNRLKFVAK